jgi:hypothetical protein
MTAVPAWWEEFTAFAAARHHPGGAVSILRETIRLLTAEPAASPQQLLRLWTPTGTASARAARTLTAFFTSHGLALPDAPNSGGPRPAGSDTSTPYRYRCRPRSPHSTTPRSMSGTAAVSVTVRPSLITANTA